MASHLPKDLCKWMVEQEVGIVKGDKHRITNNKKLWKAMKGTQYIEV